jgi:two-component sensor histidine kinase
MQGPHARGLWRRWLGPVRNRLLALMLVASVPVVGVAGSNAWNTYENARGLPVRTAQLLREASVARHLATIEGAEQMLAGLSKAPFMRGAAPEECDRVLADVLALARERYSNIWVMDADGRLRCSGVPRQRWQNFGHLAWFQEALQRRAFSLSAFQTGVATGLPVITASFPVLDGETLVGVVAAGLRQDYLVQRDAPRSAGDDQMPAVWLMDEQGRLAGAGLSDTLPMETDLARLGQGANAALHAISRGGQPFAYASTILADDVRLIVAYPAARDLLVARGLLQQRIAELVFFLIACLGAVMFGLDRSVVLPMRRMAGAVDAWRSGKGFAPGALESVPDEVRNLAETFGQATATLAQRESELRDALAHREMLLLEVNHRVKNNLQVVASLLNLQAARLRNTEARSAFATARDRVRALSTLHRHLYTQAESQRIELKAFLTELAGTLFTTMGETPGERIGLEIDAPTLLLGSDQAVPLTLLATEALSNALKFAFPDDRRGTVWIDLVIDDGQVKLSVCDDGVGMGKAAADPDSTGLGSQLIGAFARQVGGTLEVRERPGGGTVVSVRFPLAPASAGVAA